MLDNGGTVYAETIGDPVPNAYPWPAAHEVGGGVVLPCNYLIKPAANDSSTYDSLTVILSGMTAGSSMTIVSTHDVNN